MKTETYTLKELEYMLELVAEAWMYNRSTEKLSNNDQMKLSSKLQEHIRMGPRIERVE